ncbi:GTP-binding protein rhoA [Tothia fuscella]|uniref:GTP-binding protein rhoA n=1 Tax=Tothia fuscella TaxID=1048955 RepID=A0A9P4TYB1_9PEZI|nr:GTP-binding protein rhoA [Tothia fuscella]
MPAKLIKLVIVGDPASGKSALVIKGVFREDILPTVFESYLTDVEIDGKHAELALWESAGREDYDRLRPLLYPDSHVILITFSIGSPDSLDNVLEKWISEVLHFNQGVPIILVGTKKDLRYDPKTIEELAKTSQKPVTEEQGLEAKKKIGATQYLECSSRTNEGVLQVFEHAIRAGMSANAFRRKAAKKLPQGRKGSKREYSKQNIWKFEGEGYSEIARSV